MRIVRIPEFEGFRFIGFRSPCDGDYFLFESPVGVRGLHKYSGQIGFPPEYWGIVTAIYYKEKV